MQNFARAGTSLAIVDVLHALMQRVPCFTLAYSDLHDAAELFLDRFAVPFSRDSELVIDLTPVNSGLKMRITPELADSGALHFQQASDIVLRELDGELFLKRPHDDAVFHLNAVAAILWRLLEQPVSLAAAATTLRVVFPQTAPDQNRRQCQKKPSMISTRVG